MTPSTSTIASTPAPTFQRLGVRTLINCYGTYTIISGSRALTQVVEAMVAATNYYVNMDELMDKVGQRLAELTGAEWGYITSGGAAALAEVTAACIAGADPERMSRLPDATGMKNEVIIQKKQRNSYDRAIRLVGAQMIEVITLADLRAALSERTAMLAYIGDMEGPGQIPPQEMIAMGHEHGIPTLVDAAAQRPDVPNRYLQMGADAVVYSGGKCLRGPQSAGMVLGRKDLLQAAFLNAAPHHGACRPMKVGKEEIMGLLAAVEAWVLGRDHRAEWAMWEGFLETIRSAIADIPSVRTEVQQPGIANVAPMLCISWDEATLHVSPAQVYQELLHGEPPIIIHGRADRLMVMPYMMERGDDVLVARRLRELLTPRPATGEVATTAAPAVDVSGTWIIHTQYILGTSAHSMSLVQEGTRLTGSYRSQYATSEISGQISGYQVELHTVIGDPANPTHYVYQGAADGDILSGTVMLGEYSPSEYSKAAWRAQRQG